ncbi:YciI family protein [Yoonia sp.]|uniref:YciI family protein n=1 Tax=Yoonia sp. TaxID=2212373 RepID=UPI002FDB76CF
MQYMCLIYSAEGTGPQPGTPEFGAFMQAYGAFTAEMRETGRFIAGDALQSIATATCVSVREGKTIATDGPFAETKEQLGGYYLLECENLDDALAQAAKIPTATYGRIEVRPLVVWDN